MIDSLNVIYFSPTGTTRSIVTAIADQISAEKTDIYDITLSNSPDKMVQLSGNQLTIIGVPVYAGQIPDTARERLRPFLGGGTDVVLVAVYGNRAYEDALLNLQEISLNQGFTVIAAGAFIGEHSYSTEKMPIALGRPDHQDHEIAEEFGQKIAAKLQLKERRIKISGERARFEPFKHPPVAPESGEGCDLCGNCLEACPVGAITIEGNVITDPVACIWCCACVQVCPLRVRTFDIPQINQIRTRLTEGERREPEYFV